MAFAANVSKPKTISKTKAGSIRTVELKGPLPKAMNIGDGNREKDEYMCGRRHGLKRGQGALVGRKVCGTGGAQASKVAGARAEGDSRTVPVSANRPQPCPRVLSLNACCIESMEPVHVVRSFVVDCMAVVVVDVDVAADALCKLF